MCPVFIWISLGRARGVCPESLVEPSVSYCVLCSVQNESSHEPFVFTSRCDHVLKEIPAVCLSGIILMKILIFLIFVGLSKFTQLGSLYPLAYY